MDFHFPAKPRYLLAGRLRFLCRLTFELSGRRRQDAKPGLVKMYEYHQPGLGGLPLALRLSEGLGVAVPDTDALLIDDPQLTAHTLDR